MFRSIFFRVAFSLLVVLFSCEDHQIQDVFDLEGRSRISIINNTKEALPVDIENWQAIPLEAQKFDTLLPPSASTTYNLKALGRSYYNLSIGEEKHTLFTQPAAEDTIIVSDPSNSEKLTFSGGSKEINKFLLKRTQKFGSPDADWKPRSMATYHSGDFSKVIRINDSITQENISFLQENVKRVPDWYVQFETERLNYLNLGFQINSFAYRRGLLGKEESLPVNFLDEIHSTVKIENPEMLGNMRYYYFLMDYISYRKDSTFTVPQPVTKEDEQKIYTELFTTIEREFKGETRDFVLASIISRVVTEKRQILDTSWIAKVRDKKIRKYFRDQLAAGETLQKGDPVPYFSLQDVDGKYYEPKDFKDRILLINFWATWCKPCIAEFPEENLLVEKFKKEPVTIVNIAIDSDPNKWNQMVQQYELKTLNLIAKEKNSKLLREKFKIKSLPHSILIDWNGKVVQNKSLKASSGGGEQISELLEKRKREN